MKKTVRFAAAVTALSLAACASIKTDSKMSDGASFAGKATFAMIGAPPGSGRDPAIEQFLGDRVDKEVAARLKAKGYAASDREKADILVATHATMDGKIDAIRWGYTTIGWDTWGPYGYGGTVYTGAVYAKSNEYSKASLVIDVVDAKTHALAYRGWAQGAVRLNGEATQDEIRAYVESMLSRLPDRR